MPDKKQSFLLYAKNGNIGLGINDELLVIAVQKGSMADGKIFIDNKVLRLNNQVILTKDHFEQVIRDHAGQGVILVVWHDKEKIRQLAQHPLQPGFEIKEFIIVWNPVSQQKEGQAVYVTNVAENSVSSMYLQEGDRVLEIDGWPVLNSEMGRNLLVQAFRFNNRVKLKIERSVVDETKSSISAILSSVSNREPSVVMQNDVLDIMQRQRERMNQNEDPKVKCVYKADPVIGPKKSSPVATAVENKHVQIKSAVDQKFIGQDNSDMVGMLRPVPNRTPGGG